MRIVLGIAAGVAVGWGAVMLAMREAFWLHDPPALYPDERFLVLLALAGVAFLGAMVLLVASDDE